MKRKLGEPRRGTKKRFLLTQVLSMKPYLFGLMRDLRSTWIRQERLRCQLRVAAPGAPESYEERRRRHDAEAERVELEREYTALLREFRKLGVRVGKVLRGEMLFPCLIDRRDAYFVWCDSQDRPAHWCFLDEAEMHPIPERWFTMFSVDATV